MKTWKKVLLGFFAFIVVAIGAAIFLTGGMVDAADAFFTAVKNKDMAAARSHLSEDFKARTDERALAAFLADASILNFAEANWSDRTIENNRGSLSGSITTDTGGVVPIALTLVKENDAWKIFSIDKAEAGIISDTSASAAPVAPSRTAQTALVKQSTHDFVVSVAAKDMTHFRSTLSEIWQDQFSTADLNEAFGSIIASDADWTELDGFEPILAAEPEFQEHGVMVLSGHYDTNSGTLRFEQSYVLESGAWKLVGFSVNAE